MIFLTFRRLENILQLRVNSLCSPECFRRGQHSPGPLADACSCSGRRIPQYLSAGNPTGQNKDHPRCYLHSQAASPRLVPSSHHGRASPGSQHRSSGLGIISAKLNLHIMWVMCGREFFFVPLRLCGEAKGYRFHHRGAKAQNVRGIVASARPRTCTSTCARLLPERSRYYIRPPTSDHESWNRGLRP